MDSRLKLLHNLIVFSAPKTFMLFLITCALNAKAADKTIFTYLGPGPTESYQWQILRLAFEKTTEEYGPFEIRLTPTMTEARARKSIRDLAYPNPIRLDASHPLVFENPDYLYIRFPVYLGIIGYRVCFIPKSLQSELVDQSLESDLRTLVHGQGQGWRDIEILRENGFDVKVAPNSINLYRMLNANRIDLFCRGTSEVLNEKALYQDLENVELDSSVALYYPFPFFFYVNSADTHTRERVEKGIIQAYNDGSLMTLWRQHFGESVEHSNLEGRKVIKLTNKYAEDIPFDYQKYLYKP